MLFDEEGKPSPKELFDRLKERAKEVSHVLKEVRDENRRLKAELSSLREELDGLKSRVGAYEGERQELKAIVEDLLKEFEQVSR